MLLANVKIYDDIGDLEDHITRFTGMGNQGEWPMPVWCWMFQQDGKTRAWFDKFPLGSINNWGDLTGNESLSNFMRDGVGFDHLTTLLLLIMELMKVPRVESKLRVFAFTCTFASQVSDLRKKLSVINDNSIEVKESEKLRQIMQTILTLGNALNQGTARGSAIGFKLDNLLKLSDTRARNNKMTLMHYLCKLYEQFLTYAASKIPFKDLAEEVQEVSKGLEKVEQEVTALDNDGAKFAGFQKALKGFCNTAKVEVETLISLYTEVGRNGESISQYFGEDPVRCPFEQDSKKDLRNMIRDTSLSIEKRDAERKDHRLMHRIDAEVEEMLDGTPRKKSRTARDDVKMEGNKNKRRNSRNFCGGHLKGTETAWEEMESHYHSILERILSVAHLSKV
ncbi:formin-like protein 14 [Tanacetum coccineum]|uniref:Formin-like protein n=1 Tax=Tanacetum coccineum TaxID=301880 RepID=A0ABQ4YQH1_9ASTR